MPLAVITFFAAFVPLIGAFVAGLLACLVALVSGGVVDALLVLGAIILVQQVEGHVLYPLLMSRAVHLHPAVIVVSLAAGGILARMHRRLPRRPRRRCRLGGHRSRRTDRRLIRR